MLQVLIGASVITGSLLLLSLLITWWATPNPHTACTPPPLDSPGKRYRCWCYEHPVVVEIVPEGATITYPPDRRARPKGLARIRRHIRPVPPGDEGAGGTGRRGGKHPAPVAGEGAPVR